MRFGAAVLRFEGADTLVALRACRVVQFERARFDARVGFTANRSTLIANAPNERLLPFGKR